MHSKLVGHYDNVKCCAFLPEDQVLSKPSAFSIATSWVKRMVGPKNVIVCFVIHEE